MQSLLRSVSCFSRGATSYINTTAAVCVLSHPVCFGILRANGASGFFSRLPAKTQNLNSIRFSAFATDIFLPSSCSVVVLRKQLFLTPLFNCEMQDSQTAQQQRLKANPYKVERHEEYCEHTSLSEISIIAAALGVVCFALTTEKRSEPGYFQSSAAGRGECLHKNNSETAANAFSSKIFDLSYHNHYGSIPPPCWQHRRSSQLFQRDRLHLWRQAGFPASCAGLQGEREVQLGHVADFECGHIYQFVVGNEREDKILLACLGSHEFYCVGATCTHYNAPLFKGILTADGRLSCPWHDAEFDVKTGKCVNGPALCGLPSFPVHVRDDKVSVRLPCGTLPHKAQPVYAKQAAAASDAQTFVIVGGGAAAAGAMEALRTEGFEGKLVLVSAEAIPPYDRTVLSKNLLIKSEDLILRPKNVLETDLEVELWLNSQVSNIDFRQKLLRVVTKASENQTVKERSLPFDKVLLCTGSAARTMSSLSNGTASGIFTLRSVSDHGQLQQYLDEICRYNSQPRVVIIGSSFIGVETSAAMKRRGFNNITLVSQENVPMERVLGRRVGESIKQLLTTKGVKYLSCASVCGFIASQGRVTGVKLANGEILQADLVIAGIGGEPCTAAFFKDTPEAAKVLAADGGVIVDPFLRVPQFSDVFAAGDIARYPYIKTGDFLRVEHWAVAMQQGRVAATNMLGRHIPFTNIPFFWSMFFGKSIRFAGYTGPHVDEVIVEGDLEIQQFVAYYVKDDRVVAVCTMGRDPVAVAAVYLLSKNMMPAPGELRQGLKNSNDLLAIVQAEASKDKSIQLR